MRFTTARALCGDAGSVQWLTICRDRSHDRPARQPAWTAAVPLATNGRNGFNERERLSDAVAAGTDEDQRERDALGFGHEVEL